MAIKLWVDLQWQPTENTIGYRPFTSTDTYKDKSGNWYDLTENWTIVYGEYDWVDCAYMSLNSNGYFKSTDLPFPTSANPRTVHIWAKFTNTTDARDIVYLWNPNINYWNVEIWISGSSNSYKFWARQYPDSILWLVWDKLWHLHTYVADSTWYEYFIDWISMWTKTNKPRTVSVSNSYPFYVWTYNGSIQFMVWYLSNLIVEDRRWSESEIQNYFNTYKTIYWL